MCYSLLLSTTSSEDLSALSTELVRFLRELPPLADVELLRYANRWYVGSKAGCSCTFRHLSSIELGFGEPVAWYPEDADSIEATLQLVAIIRRLVEHGACVDCVDAWNNQTPEPVCEARLEVDLREVPDEAFRLFENYHFDFRAQD